MDETEDMESRYMTFCKGPTLRLQGRWLERAGFVPGTIVRIAVTRGRLVFEPVGTASDLIVRQNARTLKCAARKHARAAPCENASSSDATRDVSSPRAAPTAPKVPMRL